MISQFKISNCWLSTTGIVRGWSLGSALYCSLLEPLGMPFVKGEPQGDLPVDIFSLDVANPCTLAPHRYFQSSLQLTTEQCKIISHPLRPGEAIQVKAFAGEPCSFPLVVRKHYYSLDLKELWTELKDFSSNSVIASSIIKHGVDVYMGGVIFDFYTSHATGCLHITILLYRYGWWWNKMVESN